MPRPDLPDRILIALTVGAITAVAAWFALRAWLPENWRTPGSPQLYLTGVAGALLLLVPAAFALAKRSGRAREPRFWFNLHVGCSLAGAVLIAVHSGGFLRRPPALLLAAIVALAALGIWARVRGARLMAATFASKPHAFPLPDETRRAQLRALIDEKRLLLAQLDSAAGEGTFSVTLAHFLKQPRLAIAYLRLEREESRIIGTRRAVGPAQARWRPLHLLLAWVFVAGALIHVITVTFFAGYVADGDPITWWHLADWGAGW